MYEICMSEDGITLPTLFDGTLKKPTRASLKKGVITSKNEFKCTVVFGSFLFLPVLYVTHIIPEVKAPFPSWIVMKKFWFGIVRSPFT